MYKVIQYFTDLQDKGYAYKVGDIFPRQGKSVSDARIKELSTNANKRKMPLIEKVDETKVEVEEVTENSDYTKTDINRMPLVELQALATKNGIEGASDMKGSQLKKELITILDL